MSGSVPLCTRVIWFSESHPLVTPRVTTVTGTTGSSRAVLTDRNLSNGRETCALVFCGAQRASSRPSAIHRPALRLVLDFFVAVCIRSPSLGAFSGTGMVRRDVQTPLSPYGARESLGEGPRHASIAAIYGALRDSWVGSTQ